MGHMQGLRQGVLSTRPVDAPGTTNDANPPNITVPPVSNPAPTAYIVAHDVLSRVIDLKDTMYMDQTGHFPFCLQPQQPLHHDPPPRGLQLLLEQGPQE